MLINPFEETEVFGKRYRVALPVPSSTPITPITPTGAHIGHGQDATHVRNRKAPSGRNATNLERYRGRKSGGKTSLKQVAKADDEGHRRGRAAVGAVGGAAAVHGSAVAGAAYSGKKMAGSGRLGVAALHDPAMIRLMPRSAKAKLGVAYGLGAAGGAALAARRKKVEKGSVAAGLKMADTSAILPVKTKAAAPAARLRSRPTNSNVPAGASAGKRMPA